MKKIILAFLIWRIALFIIAYVSPNVIPTFGARFPYYQEKLIDSNLPHFIWSFANFDGVHYLGIAQGGYWAQYTQAFFPLYPLLIKIFSFVTLGNLIIAGLVISNICFLAALILFYKLIKIEKNEKVAFWSILFILSFPTAFFFGSLYTESLFFLQIVAVFYFLSKGKQNIAAIIAFSAALTKFVGIFLAPFVAISKKSINIPALIISSFGLAVYMFYLKVAFNNPLYFLTAQPVFGQERSANSIVLLPQVFFRYLKIFQTTNGLTLNTAVLEFAVTIFALVILILSFKKIKTQWIIFSLIAILTPTLTGTLASMPRYVLVAFPIYIVLATINKAWLKITILVIFVTLQVISLTLFSQGYWVA